VDGVLGHHGEIMDLVQHHVGNVDHLAIHNENITKVDLVIILLPDMEEVIVQALPRPDTENSSKNYSYKCLLPQSTILQLNHVDKL
jgi:hypothetical protein